MEENDYRNYFMIYLHESMGPSWDQTRDPWICSQTNISLVENRNDLELDFKVFFFVDSCCSGIVLDESN